MQLLLQERKIYRNLIKNLNFGRDSFASLTVVRSFPTIHRTFPLCGLLSEQRPHLFPGEGFHRTLLPTQNLMRQRSIFPTCIELTEKLFSCTRDAASARTLGGTDGESVWAEGKVEWVKVAFAQTSVWRNILSNTSRWPETDFRKQHRAQRLLTSLLVLHFY